MKPYFNILYRISFAIYLFIGVLYFNWTIFPIIFLFWCENMMEILILILIVNTFPHIQQEEDINHKSSIYVRIFMNTIYFVFITFGYGFISLLSLKSEVSKDNLGAIIKIFAGLDRTFNISLCLIFLKILSLYVFNFHIKKIYNANNLFIFPDAFGYKELILHLSIIIGLGGSLWLSKITSQNNENNFLTMYGFVSVFLVLKLVVDIFVELKKKKKNSKTKQDKIIENQI